MRTFVKRILPLFLLLLTVVSCSPSAPGGKEETVPETLPETDPVIDRYELTVAGTPISEYRIVYAQSPYTDADIRRFEETGEDYDFFYLTALELADRIRALTGVSLEVTSDKQEPTDREILVGPTARAESEKYKAMDAYGYEIAVENGKLTVGGGYLGKDYVNGLKVTYCFASTYHAWDYAEKEIRGAKKVQYDFAEGSRIRGNAAGSITTVAMIGDSITDMAHSTAVTYNYPSSLQRCLWKDFFVLNYGITSTTMRLDLSDTYTKCAGYKAATQFCDLFDVVVVMLGTNDSNRDRDWTPDDDDAFIEGCKFILDTVVPDNDSVKTVIVSSPAYYGKDGFTSDDVLYLQEKMPEYLTEDGYANVSYFDMNTYTDEVLTAARYPDKLHPDNDGCLLMAEGIAEYLTGLCK